MARQFDQYVSTQDRIRAKNQRHDAVAAVCELVGLDASSLADLGAWLMEFPRGSDEAQARAEHAVGLAASDPVVLGVFEQAASLHLASEGQSDEAVFARLGYEPICKPRIKARKEGRDIPPCGLCPQELFHASTEFDVLFGGAAGGGKSLSALMVGIADCMRYPGIAVAGFRRTYDELSESLLKELAKHSFAEELGASWNASKYVLSFPNGSTFRFRHAEVEKHATRRQGGEFQRLIIDERGLMAPAVVGLLEERLRSGDKRIPVLGIRSTSNPGGPGHAALKVRYITGTTYGRQTYTDDHGKTVRFIPAKVSDNPHLDADYESRVLGAIPDLARRAAMKDGNWDVYVGQYFDQWSQDRHVVAPFTIPAEWVRREGIDYGFSAPWCVLWGAEDQDGRVWVYREMYASQVGQSDQAARILSAEQETGETIKTRAADPSMWAKTGEHNSNAQIYAEHGVLLAPANNNRVHGWARVHHYLSDAPACDLHRAEPFGWETCPLLHVFETCTNLIRTLPPLERSKLKPEDVADGSEDHAPDALRYLLMAIWGGPAQIESSPATRRPEPRIGQGPTTVRRPRSGIRLPGGR